MSVCSGGTLERRVSKPSIIMPHFSIISSTLQQHHHHHHTSHSTLYHVSLYIPFIALDIITSGFDLGERGKEGGREGGRGMAQGIIQVYNSCRPYLPQDKTHTQQKAQCAQTHMSVVDTQASLQLKA